MDSIIETLQEKVFETTHCKISQCDVRNSFLVSVFGHEMEMQVCSLFMLKRRIYSINLESLLNENSSGIEIINLSCNNRVFVFTIQEILEMRQLLEGTFAMLEINSIIHTSLRRKIFN